MGLVFIPIKNYSRDANTAATITDIDIGSVCIGTSVTFCFRLGNTGDTAVDWTLSVVDNYDPDTPDKWQLPEGGSLAPGETTNTLTVGMRLPLNAVEMGHVVNLIATDGNTEYTLEISYEAMGTNSFRRSQYPRRVGDWTDTASNVITQLGDKLRILVFDPMPYVGAPGYGQKVPIIIGPKCTKLAGYREMAIQDGSDPCQRLHPHNEKYGYTQSTYIVFGQFSNENRETRYFNLRATSTEMEYQVSARLSFCAEDELIRHWALFSGGSETEPAQYKRSVFVLQRQGELFSIENIKTIDRGTQLSHFEADLVALHNWSNGKSSFWNPFAITFDGFESDIPYAMFSCHLDLPKDEPYWGGSEISGSLNPSSSPPEP